MVLVDVREDREWAAGRIEGAVHLGKGVVERDAEKTWADPDTELVLYCGGGYLPPPLPPSRTWATPACPPWTEAGAAGTRPVGPPSLPTGSRPDPSLPEISCGPDPY